MKFGNALALIGASTLGLATVAQAQTAYWPAPTQPGQPVRNSYFPMGTPLTLTTRTVVSTKDNKPGDRFYLEVAEDLSYRGQVVVPAGSVAVGEVAMVQRNGHFGKKGKLDINLLYVQTPQGPVRISGKANDEGTSGTITSVATMALVSPLGFVIHGTSAHIPAGSVVHGYLAQDLRFAAYAQPVESAMIGAAAEPDAMVPLPASFETRKTAAVQTAAR